MARTEAVPHAAQLAVQWGPALEWCVAVPPAGHGVCPVCHGFRRRGFELCSSCQRVRARLPVFCPLVLPISLAATVGSPLYRVLRGYKDLRRAPGRRARDLSQLASLVTAFLTVHGSCIAEAAGERWDCLTTVPSSGPHPAHHPLVELAGAIGPPAGRHLELLRRGPAATGHLRPSAEGFVAGGEAVGLSVLVLDDTWTSGARAQSVTSALERAGARVLAIVPIARLVRPAYLDGAWFWQRQRAERFDPAVCCLEGR
jgi:adenine/guanine phosphoribosyltransferase-like PRPP-binding protein